MLQTETISALSDDPWKQWNPSDYGSAEEYCRSCLLDKNVFDSGVKYTTLCSIPLVPPKGGATNRKAVEMAEKTLIDPKSDISQTTLLRKEAAQKLLHLMEIYGLAPRPELVEVSRLED